MALGAGTAHASFKGKNGLLAFEVPKSKTFNVYTSTISGKQRRRLSCSVRVIEAASCRDRDPVWSPDGTRLAISNAEGIATEDPDGHDVTQVVSIKSVSNPAWSADGSFLYYQNKARIYAVNIDGSGTNLLPHGQFLPEVSSLDQLAVLDHNSLAIYDDTTKLNSLPAPVAFDWTPLSRLLVARHAKVYAHDFVTGKNVTYLQNVGRINALAAFPSGTGFVAGTTGGHLNWHKLGKSVKTAHLITRNGRDPDIQPAGVPPLVVDSRVRARASAIHPKCASFKVTSGGVVRTHNWGVYGITCKKGKSLVLGAWAKAKVSAGAKMYTVNGYSCRVNRVEAKLGSVVCRGPRTGPTRFVHAHIVPS
jgi:hypothetical protein